MSIVSPITLPVKSQSGVYATSKNGVLVSIGNHKIGRDTMIINITSARDCMAKKLGLCQFCGRKHNPCYARKAEKQYPQVLPYRRRQTGVWDRLSADEIADGLIQIATRRRKTPIRYLRFSEAGDFRTQADVKKMAHIAIVLNRHNIIIYGYTARKDLDYARLPKNMVVQGSGFMVHNQFTAVKTPKKGAVCAGNCRICGLCKTRSRRRIQVTIH